MKVQEGCNDDDLRSVVASEDVTKQLKLQE
jgi:hypothetical protein